MKTAEQFADEIDTQFDEHLRILAQDYPLPLSAEHIVELNRFFTEELRTNPSSQCLVAQLLTAATARLIRGDL